MKDYKIYCVYHDTKFIDEYNLKETDNFKLYFTKNEAEEKYNLNYVQLYLNEWVAQYYVWKNNIKSDFIGFCHYRRPLYNYDNIDDEFLNYIDRSQYYVFEVGKYIQGTLNNTFYYVGLSYHINLLKKYISEKYGEFYLNRFNSIIYSDCFIAAYRELYFCKWGVFCKLTSFIDGYLKYLFKHILDTDEKELYEYSEEDYEKVSKYLNEVNWNLKEEFVSSNNLEKPKYYFGYPRCLAFMLEFITPLIFELFFGNKNYKNIHVE